MKKKLLGSVLLSLCAVLGCTAPAMADSRKVVTLGSDLTQEQMDTMMRYFGVGYDSVDLLYITNQDERTHLGSYVPLEQIGNYTYSCALVAPTSSGGIQVKTANLEWVTCNMIASTLSTSGVTNCQVVAASPFKVSGTGALTGVIMAYEQASEEELEPQKVELANQELIATGNLANEVGQSKATAVMNETKIQVIENNVTNKEEITNIVNNVSNDYDVAIDADQSDEIAELMQKIAEQEYDITQLKATLDRVQANVAGDAGATEEEIAAAEQRAEESAKAALEAAKQADEEGLFSGDPENEGLEQDGIIIAGDETEMTEETEESILDNTDPGVLEVDGAVIDEADTTQSVQQQQSEQQSQETENPFGIPEASGDGTMDENVGLEILPEENVQQDTQAATDGAMNPVTTEAPADTQMTEPVIDTQVTEAPGDTQSATEGTMDTQATEAITQPGTAISPDLLETEDKAIYDQTKADMEMTFSGGVVADNLGNQVFLTQQAAQAVPEKIEQYMLEVMTKGADAVAMTESADPAISQTIVEDTAAQAPDRNYQDANLKQIDKFVRRLIFTDPDQVLADSQLEDADRVILYDRIMGILESSYKVEAPEQTEAPAMEEAADEVGLETAETPAADAQGGVMDTQGLAAETEGMADAAAYTEMPVDEFAGFEEQEGVF